MSNKSCSNCPSFLNASSVIDKFGRNTGSPMCGRYGHVLGKPDLAVAEERKLQAHIADKCPSYGEPMPSEPQERRMQVMLPDPEMRDLNKIDEVSKAACTSCAMCRNYINESTVMDETGWTTGMCAAKGKLLLTNRLSFEARDCEYRQVGPQRGTMGGLHFLPEYNEAFTSSGVSPVAAYFTAKKAGFVDPTDYPTDREVSEEEATAGIRAWRRVVDPDGSDNEVYFPIFEAAFFDDSDRELIPKTGTDEHPELYVDHFGGLYGLGVAWFELDETPIFHGEAGVGKTELLRYAAWVMQVPFRRISITKSTEIDDIAGKYEYSPESGTYFRYGRLVEAWQRPGVICLDEPNVAGDPAVWHFIRPLTDNSKQLVLDMYDHRLINRNTDCYMGMAVNPAWDPRNVGAMEIADADANRLFHFYIEMPPDALEREIIKARVALDGWEISTEQLDMVMSVAKDLRALSKEGELPITWALRPQIKVARALRWFNPPTAYRRAAGDALEPEALELVLDQVRAHWKEV